MIPQGDKKNSFTKDVLYTPHDSLKSHILNISYNVMCVQRVEKSPNLLQLE